MQPGHGFAREPADSVRLQIRGDFQLKAPFLLLTTEMQFRISGRFPQVSAAIRGLTYIRLAEGVRIEAIHCFEVSSERKSVIAVMRVAK